jgi:hypothetical protein
LLKVTNTLTATVTFGLLTQQSFLKKLIVALGKTLGKPIMSNDGITPFDNCCLAIPVKHYLSQSPMTIMLGSLVFSFGNTICLYHFDFYHYPYWLHWAHERIIETAVYQWAKAIKILAKAMLTAWFKKA